MGKRVLIGCEFSGRVREAFARRGWNAWSCDYEPTEIPGQHVQGDVVPLLHQSWDLLIVFPPCRYLCSSGLHWNKRDPQREAKTFGAIAFAKVLWNAPVKYIALENSVGRLSTAIRKPDQIIQPYQFGADASKSTCLWLKNLPLLRATRYVEPRLVVTEGGATLKRWANQMDSGQNRLPPSPDRWKERSRTYEGVADAMAEQWGNHILYNT